MKLNHQLIVTALLGLVVSGSSQAAVVTLWEQNFDSQTGFTDALKSTHPDNWGKHYRHSNDEVKAGLWTDVVGHIGDGYSGTYDGTDKYANNEKSIYTVQFDLRGVKGDAGDNLKLQFNYDAEIYTGSSNGDGFSVAAYTGALQNTFDATDISNLQLLNPTSGMTYQTIGNEAGPALTMLNGSNQGFQSWEQNGTAMFNLAGLNLAGSQFVNVRFAFASGASSVNEGINIDKIKIRGECSTVANGDGSFAGCAPPPMTGVVPEPGTLVLSALGLAAIYRRRRAASPA